MERQEGEALSLCCYKPKVGDDKQSPAFDRSVQDGTEPMEVDQCETAGDMDDSQLVGASDAIAPKNGVLESAALGLDGSVVDVEVKLAAKSVEKRKRGRPPRGQGQVKPAPKNTEEEDVCFICFDGGSLVLCDRRGCPKAYHPACIKRDEAFFRSKAKWNCGWHICSSCRKASHYMCYTCTYSLCKGCIKDADYVCVRGNKGLCGTCMRTIMLIENIPGNKEMAQVDFDDKTSWEYLFKVYWVLLKGQLSLTLDEVIKAKNPWKGPSVVGLISGSSCEFYRGNVDKHSILGGNSSTNLEAIDSKRNTISTKPEVLKKENSLGVENSVGDRVVPLLEDTNWASKELLELVAHMKNGDTSAMSQSDAKMLLLEYIKKNSLRDPRQKGQIVCDSRLLNMFGKESVGLIEMEKLLESHYLIKDNSPVNNPISAGLVDAVGSPIESDQNYDSHLAVVNDKKRKVRKRIDEKGQQNNLDAHAAIDVHNINLIYLKRNWLETLIDDADKFHEKVVGSIVRIRLSSNDQKPDMHRLVQVVGTIKVAEPYKIGMRETNVMLEILNLDMKEVISIEGISDQDFSQDECERFCQSITCGLIKWLTVGEIQDKAMALLAVKVNDWLEAEILRLTNLRDQASEKGRRKELRECVEKLKLLNSPEDRQRRLQEVPVVHSDPTMDPSNKFEDNSGELDEKETDDKVKPRNSGFCRKRRLSISPQRERDVLTSSGTNALKDVTTPIEQSRGKETFGINGWNTTDDQLNPTGSSTMSGNSQEVAGSVSFFSTASEMPAQPLSTGTNQHVNDFETEKIWHYADPTGKVQGPFAMLQLRKWNSDGHFPLKLRIWRRNEKKENAILLNDALSGQCRKEQLLPFESNLLLQAVKVASYYDENGTDVGWNESMNDTPEDGKRVGESSNLEQEPSRSSDKNNEVGTCNRGDSNLSSCTTLVVVNSNKGQNGISSQGQDLSSNDIWPHQQQVSSSLPTTVVPSKETLSIEVGEDHVTERTDVQSNGNFNVPEGQTSNDQGCGNKSDSEGHSSQSSGQNWRPPPVNSPSKGQDSNSGYTSMAKSVETSEQNQEEIKISDLPSSTPKPSKYISSNVPVQDTGLSWSTASSLVGGGTQFCEVAGEWGGCSTEMTNDHAATPASISDHLTHSPAHPQSITSSWPDIVTDSLVDESVSDLLAEVEAMESLNGLASQALVNCGDELTEVSKSDCISSAEVFSPPPDPGKGDALSSTGDAHLHILCSNFDNSDVLNPEKRSKGYSSVSPEAEGDTKHSDVSVNQLEANAEPQPAPTTRWDATVSDIPWNLRQESMDTTTIMGWPGLDQGDAMMGWGAGQGTTTHGNTSMNSGAPAVGILGSQPRYSEDRFSPRDRAYPSRDSGYNRSGSGRYAWNRQPVYSGGSNGGSFRSPPKGQRVCKFYESGFCKKGASCSYWHPPRP